VFLVGLTGGIASGKSRVASRFVHHGCELIDADEIAREVVLPGTEGYRRVVEHFGEEVLDEDGFIDRPRLGRLVFADPRKRAALNELTHPRVVAEIANRLELLTAFDGVVVVDVPLLVEAGVNRGYEAVVVVATQPETQVRRLIDLRGMDEADARQRVESQAPLEDKLAIATHVIWNEGTLAEVDEKADEVARELSEAARKKADAMQHEIPND
jgi:dephospho-CoA kinase